VGDTANLAPSNYQDPPTYFTSAGLTSVPITLDSATQFHLDIVVGGGQYVELSFLTQRGSSATFYTLLNGQPGKVTLSYDQPGVTRQSNGDPLTLTPLTP
jgi:hypothetical protein